MSVSFPDDLLVQARDLAEKEPRKPKQASLRRAVSSAYYALFHFLGEESTKLVVGALPNRRLLRQVAMRSVSHSKLKGVCKEFQKSVPKDSLKPIWGSLPNPELTTICEALCDLQELRHEADYDLTLPVTRQGALDACFLAEEAMAAWGRIKGAERELLHRFATILLLWSGLSQR